MPSGLAIILGAGPNTGTGIARILSSPKHGNMAVALLARRQESLQEVKKTILQSNSESVVETFVSDTTPLALEKAFSDIKSHASLRDLKLTMAVFSVKHSSKKPFLEETHEDFTKSMTEYVSGAMVFSQLVIKRLFDDHGSAPLAEGGAKKGTLIFTGTLGALRTNAQYSSYGASRAGVRMLAQGLAKEYSKQGVHVVHTIANGSIVDANGQDQKSGKKMSADAVGKTYLWLAQQEPELWTHELDLRPAQEAF